MGYQKRTGNRTATIKALFEISSAVNTTDSLDDLYAAIHVSLNRILNLENFAVAIYHKEKDSITLPYFVDEMDTNPGEVFDISKKQSLTARVINAGKPLIFFKEDIKKLYSGPAESPPGSVCKVWAGAPLKIRDQSFGALVVQSYRSKDAFKKTDLDLLNSVAEFIAVSIERKQLEIAQKQSNEINQVLREITSAIHSSENLNQLFETIHHILSQIIDVSNFYISLYEKKTDTISFPFFRDEYDDATTWDVSGLRDHFLTYEVFKALKPVFLRKPELDILARQKRLVGTVPYIWLGIPLMTKSEPIGLMAVQSYSDPELFDQKDVDILCSVSEQIAVAIERKRAEEAVKESEARFRALIDHSYDAVFIHESDGRLIDVNKTMLKMFKISHDEAFVYNIADYVGPESSRAEVQDNWVRAIAGEDLLFPLQARRPKDGSLFDAEVYLTRIIFNDRRIILGNIRDITRRKKAEKALQVSEEKYRLLFENSVEGIYQTSPEGRFIAANPSFLRIFGFDSSQELFEHFKDIGKEQYLNPEDRVTFKRIVEAEGFVRGFETQLRKKDGTPIWVSLNSRAVKNDRGVLLYYEGFMQDITERKKAEQELYRVSIHDHLTGIFNRRYVFERLDTLIKEYQRETRDFSLSIVDLDFFKKINDTHGHPAGDFILREFAGILSESFRPYDLVGRYGGEEFIVVAMNIDMQQTQTIFIRLREIVRGRVFDFNGSHLSIAFSAGVVNTSETGLEMTVENLIRKADERLYLAKEQGRDRIVCESPEPGADLS